eukprot:scaffold425784_cov17-Prasinocladus_malaysianus.AAC.1
MSKAIICTRLCCGVVGAIVRQPRAKHGILQILTSPMNTILPYESTTGQSLKQNFIEHVDAEQTHRI